MKLSPCPFCGSENLYFVTWADEDRAVECGACAAMGPPAFAQDWFLPGTPEFKAVDDEAARKWNKRC